MAPDPHSKLSNIVVSRALEAADRICLEMEERGFTTGDVGALKGMRERIANIIEETLEVTATYSFIPPPIPAWIELNGDGMGGDLENQL